MTRSLLLKQPQTRNTQDAAVARSEEVGNFAGGVASNKLSRIWAPVGKCKRKPFSSATAMGDKARRPWEVLVFTGEPEWAGGACGRECPRLTGGVRGSGGPLSSAKTCEEHPEDELLWVQTTASLLCKEILNYVGYLRHAICLGASPSATPGEKKAAMSRYHSINTPVLLASVLLLSFHVEQRVLGVYPLPDMQCIPSVPAHLCGATFQGPFLGGLANMTAPTYNPVQPKAELNPINWHSGWLEAPPRRLGRWRSNLLWCLCSGDDAGEKERHCSGLIVMDKTAVCRIGWCK